MRLDWIWRRELRSGKRSYHPGHFAALLQDPDGNNGEAVHTA
jgi:hypothetical protein